MSTKNKRGRKKQFNSLVKLNFRIEQDTLDKLNEIVVLINEVKQTRTITLSDVARRILDRRCSLLIAILKQQLSRKATKREEIKAAASEFKEDAELKKEWDDFLGVSSEE